MPELLLTAVLLVTVVGPFLLGRRGHGFGVLVVAWLLPLGLLLWSFLASRTEDPATCQEACGSLWLFVLAAVAVAPAVLGTALGVLGVQLGRRSVRPPR